VLYEDLARRPREALRPVCEMLDVAWTKTLLRPTIQGHLWRGNSMHGQEFDQVSQAAIGRYVHSISPAEQIRIESKLAGYFDRFGWPRSTESSAVSARRWPQWKFWKAA
jgi:hypothetical protein